MQVISAYNKVWAIAAVLVVGAVTAYLLWESFIDIPRSLVRDNGYALLFVPFVHSPVGILACFVGVWFCGSAFVAMVTGRPAIYVKNNRLICITPLYCSIELTNIESVTVQLVTRSVKLTKRDGMTRHLGGRILAETPDVIAQRIGALLPHAA